MPARSLSTPQRPLFPYKIWFIGTMNRTALNGVSFDVRPAELFGLLGPNGSGKTTLFRILSTLMIPTAGRAVVMGFDAAEDPASLRRQIGVVFQAQSVDPSSRHTKICGIRGTCTDCVAAR